MKLRRLRKKMSAYCLRSPWRPISSLPGWAYTSGGINRVEGIRSMMSKVRVELWGGI